MDLELGELVDFAAPAQNARGGKRNAGASSLTRTIQELLGKGREDWGSYYDHNPQVMVGRLRDGAAALQLGKVRGRQGEPI